MESEKNIEQYLVKRVKQLGAKLTSSYRRAMRECRIGWSVYQEGELFL